MLLLCALANGAISTDIQPELGQAVVISVTDPEGHGRGGETVRVVHRPGLAGEREIAIGITDGLGRVRWTPEIRGVARLRAGDQRLPVHIGAPSAPPATLLLLLLLLLASAGAVGWGVHPRRLR
jgi:hypothetical protein